MYSRSGTSHDVIALQKPHPAKSPTERNGGREEGGGREYKVSNRSVMAGTAAKTTESMVHPDDMTMDIQC